MKFLPRFIHVLGSPAYYYQWTGRLIPWLTAITAILFAVGLYCSFFIAPADYQQGESYRIMFIHVPSAWLSMMAYMVMAIAGVIALIWRIKVAETTVMASAPIGAMFTAFALITGMLWGKPMWGAYWVWDARLTSELVLLFLYIGVIALGSAIEEKRSAARACSILAIVGVVNIPIIHYSVVWWNTLHQGASVSKFDAPSIHVSMLIPLLIMVVAFKTIFFLLLFMRSRTELLLREQNTKWVNSVLEETKI